MNLYRFSLSLALSLTLWFQAPATPTTYNIQKYSTINGLTNNVVYGIIQDKKGFIWLATEDGLNRFDGYKFISYRYNPTNKQSVSQNFIQAIYCDNNGDIWVGTADCGLNKYVYDKDKFEVYRHDKNKIGSINGNDITSILPSLDGNLWIASYRNGINWFDKKRGIFYNRKDILASCPVPGNYRVLSMLESRKHTFFVGTQGNGLYAYDLNHHKSVAITADKFAGLTIYTLKEDRKGNIWVGTNRGLVVLKYNNGAYEPQPTTPNVDGKAVNSILFDRSGNVWIGTEKGVYIFKLQDYLQNSPLKIQLIDESNTSNGLSYRSVRSIFQDKDGNIWIGTFTGGVNFISAIPEKFKLLTKDIPNNALSYNKVWGLCQDKQGNLWIGTDGFGIDKYDPSFKKIGNYRSNPSNPNTLSNNSILAACCDRDGTLWFGTFEGGLNRMDPLSGQIKRYQKNGTNKSISDNTIRALFEDSKQKLWVGTDAGGLCMLDKHTGIFTTYNTSNSKISENSIRAICEDKSGNLWVGTYGEGLNRIERNGRITTFKHNEDLPETINSNSIQSLIVDEDGVLWIGTSNGLCLFDSQHQTFKTLTEKNGLINNSVMGLVEDRSHNLWISTTRGVSKYCKKNQKFENYDLYDGLQSGQFLPGSVLRCSNGTILLGGTNGLNFFDPSKIITTRFEPDVVITELLISNAKVQIRSSEDPNSPLEHNISTTKKLKLSYKQNTITIGFVAINYSFPEKTQYAYLLEGVDKDWNIVGNQLSATYRYLSPGKYTFKVKATNQDGVWSSKESQITIIIRPPFWLTWWAYLIYLAITIFLVNAGLRIYTFRIRAINEINIAHLEQRKSEEVHQAKLQFFTNISHEFRTPLTLIIGPLEKFIKTEDDPFKKKQFDMMNRNANRLLRLINQLLDLRKMENGDMKVKVKEIDLGVFLEDTVFSFEELSYRKHITLQVVKDPSPINGWIDPEFLDKILYNLLSNAFKFTPSGGSITISAKKIEDGDRQLASISVVDTGKGMREQDLERIFELFYQIPGTSSSLQKGSGIGLHLTQALIKLHKGTIEVSSSEDKGTSITFTLPLDRSQYTDEEISVEPYTLSQEHEPTLPIGELGIELNETDEQKTRDRFYTVLIVEDDDDIRRYLRDELSHQYNILEAVNGQEGLEKANEYQPNLVISDVMMPIMDGIELCQSLKQSIATSHIPIIMLTAKSSIEDRIIGLENGADSYIPKPFNPLHLKTRIAKLIENRELLKQAFSRSITFQAKEVVATSPDEKFLQKALNLIHENISNSEYNGDMLSKDLGMSRTNLHRKLKAMLGQSSSEFIRIIRLKQAAVLLKQKKFTVAEVGYEVGFNSPTYFTSSFSSYFKMTPSEYIARNS